MTSAQYIKDSRSKLAIAKRLMSCADEHGTVTYMPRLEQITVFNPPLDGNDLPIGEVLFRAGLDCATIQRADRELHR